jgi:hypothetical protein
VLPCARKHEVTHGTLVCYLCSYTGRLGKPVQPHEQHILREYAHFGYGHSGPFTADKFEGACRFAFQIALVLESAPEKPTRMKAL